MEYLKPREIGEGVYDLKDLMSVELHADHGKCNIQQLENFMLRWETCLTGMKREPDEDTKLTLLKKQIENIELLDYDTQAYRRIKDPAQKTYSHLFFVCQNLIDMNRLEENQRLVHRSTRRSQSPARAAPATHQSPRGRSTRSTSRSGRPREKTKSGSRGRSRSPSPRRRPKSPGHKSNRKNTVCYDFQKGKCNRGAGSKYSHDKESSPKRSFSPRRASPGRSLSPASKKKIPCKPHAKGTCKYGDKCFYSHSMSAAPATPEDRKGANSPAPLNGDFP